MFRYARIVSDKTTNQRLKQKRTLNENNVFEITTNPVASAAGPTGVANLSYVSQYTDLPMKSANLPLMFVVTSDKQCISIEDINPIFSSVTLEAHNQIPSSNMKALKNTVKVNKSISGKKKVYTKPSGPTKRKYTFRNHA